MKTCPICAARTFDDMDTCYNCMHHFKSEPSRALIQSNEIPCKDGIGGERMDAAENVGANAGAGVGAPAEKTRMNARASASAAVGANRDFLLDDSEFVFEPEAATELALAPKEGTASTKETAKEREEMMVVASSSPLFEVGRSSISENAKPKWVIRIELLDNVPEQAQSLQPVPPRCKSAFPNA